MAAGLKFVCALVLCMLVVSPITTTAITCEQVSSQMNGCLNYLRDGGPLPSACCDGLRNLNNMAQTTPDRQAACWCVKSISEGKPNFKNSRALALPGKCGVDLPYQINHFKYCNSVQ